MESKSYLTVPTFITGLTVLFTMSLSAYHGPGGGDTADVVFLLVTAIYGIIEGVLAKQWSAPLARVSIIIILTGLGRLPEENITQIALGSLGGAMVCLPFFGLGALLGKLGRKRNWHIILYVEIWDGLSIAFAPLKPFLIILVSAGATTVNFLLRNSIVLPHTTTDPRTVLWVCWVSNRQTALFAAVDLWTIGAWLVTIIWVIAHYLRRAKSI